MKTIDYTTYRKPSDYQSFKQGDTTIRIISEGYIGLQHGMRTSVRWVNLGLCTELDTCEHCLKGNEPKRFWKWIVVDRATSEVKLRDAGVMLGDQICQIIQKNNGDTKYDIIVHREGEKLKTKYTARKSEKDLPITPDEVSRWKAQKRYIHNKHLK